MPYGDGYFAIQAKHSNQCLDIAGAVTVRVAVFVTPLSTAEMTALVLTAWGRVVTVKVFVFVPEATVTDAGTVAALVFPLESVTTFPPVGAFALSVTVLSSSTTGHSR